MAARKQAADGQSGAGSQRTEVLGSQNVLCPLWVISGRRGRPALMSAKGHKRTYNDHIPDVRFWGQSRHNSTLPSKTSTIRSSSMKKEKDHVHFRE